MLVTSSGFPKTLSTGLAIHPVQQAEQRQDKQIETLNRELGFLDRDFQLQNLSFVLFHEVQKSHDVVCRQLRLLLESLSL
jgi:hypothetical protein